MPSTGFYPDYINTSLPSGGAGRAVGGGRGMCDACPNHSSVWEQASFTSRLTPCLGGGRSLTSINGFITKIYCNIRAVHSLANILLMQHSLQL